MYGTMFGALAAKTSTTSDPIHQRDVYRRWIDWMRKHFDSAPGTH